MGWEKGGWKGWGSYRVEPKRRDPKWFAEKVCHDVDLSLEGQIGWRLSICHTAQMPRLEIEGFHRILEGDENVEISEFFPQKFENFNMRQCVGKV